MIEDLLDKTLDVQRETTTKSRTGAVKRDVMTTRHAAVPCTFWPASATTREEFARRDQVAEFEFCTETDIQPEPADRIVCGGRTYAVLGYKPYENAGFGDGLYITICGRRNQTQVPAT